LSRTEGWTSWEKERATRSFLASWSHENPQEAWNWYQKERARFDQDFSSSILVPWAASDLEEVKSLLSTVETPEARRAAIETIGKVMARKNTDEAVTWADGLENSNERDAAHHAVYEGAPRGIGAALTIQNGFPTVSAIVPGSPLDGTGVKPGDQFVAVRLADGANHALYGRDLETAVNLLRGEPGSEITIRVLRRNSTSGSFEEHLIPVQRGQLYLNEKSLLK
jgi:C-terminal processing protease CtpA/Prc